MTAIIISAVSFEAKAQQATHSVAEAQADLFARDRNISVREHPRPGYEAGGMRVGAFMAYPKLELDAEYNDNIFATRGGKVDDTIWRVRPELLLQSTWSRHYLSAYARASVNKYADHATEDTDDWDVGFDGRIDMLRTDMINTGAEASRLTEPRTSSSVPTTAARPIQYDYDQANLAFTHVFNRIKLSARGDWRRFDYGDVPSLLGGVIDEDDRDRTATYLSGRGDYALSPDTAMFVQITGNNRDYRLPGTVLAPARNSKGYEALGGVNFDITNLVRGEVGVGYLSQNFASPLYGDVHSIGARARVEWFPTQLTTITGTVNRSVEDSGITRSGGYLTTNTGVQIDHELLRNLILSAQVTYGKDDYNGVDRRDSRFVVGASATWLINRRVGVNFGYSHFNQTSSGAASGPEFKVNRGTLALILQY